MNLSDLSNKTGHYLNKNSAGILMGLSLAGVLSTAYLAHKAAQKAQLAIQDFETKDNGLWVKSTAKEKVQLTWTYYIPTILSCGATLAVIIGNNTVQNRKSAALVTAVSLGETAFGEYREKMVETLGKNKELKARDEIVQKNVTAKEGDFEKLVLVNSQDQYVYDTFSGRAFVSSVDKLNKAANEVARDCINNDYAALNSFYDKIGLAHIPVGDEVGWNNGHPLEINLSSAVVLDGKGLLAINYQYQPKVGYDSLW